MTFCLPAKTGFWIHGKVLDSLEADLSQNFQNFQFLDFSWTILIVSKSIVNKNPLTYK
jgi:hypothetical protein